MALTVFAEHFDVQAFATRIDGEHDLCALLGPERGQNMLRSAYDPNTSLSPAAPI